MRRVCVLCRGPVDGVFHGEDEQTVRDKVHTAALPSGHGTGSTDLCSVKDAQEDASLGLAGFWVFLSGQLYSGRTDFCLCCGDFSPPRMPPSFTPQTSQAAKNPFYLHRQPLHASATHKLSPPLDLSSSSLHSPPSFLPHQAYFL